MDTEWEKASSPGWFRRVSSSSLATTILNLSLLSMTKIMAWPSLHNIKRAKRQIIGSQRNEYSVNKKRLQKKHQEKTPNKPDFSSNFCHCNLPLTFESCLISEIQSLGNMHNFFRHEAVTCPYKVQSPHTF